VSATYNGDYVLIYPDHVDLSTNTTLVAVPGESYDVRACNGNIAAIPDDGRWTVLVPTTSKEVKKDAVKAADVVTPTDERVETSG